jgi:hypothetical protein
MLILVFGGGIYSCVISLSTGTCCSWNLSIRGSFPFGGEACLNGVGSLTGGGMAVYDSVQR